MSGRFAGARAVVLGAGVAGRASATALVAEGAQVTLTDVKSADDVGDVAGLTSIGVDVRLGGHRPQDLDGADIVVASPGIPPIAPVFAWAAERGLDVWGELELGARLATVPYLGVTGTNGKTTTTGMIASCLRGGGLDAVACGNIGFPFTTAAQGDAQVLVVEASSFQLSRHRSFHPQVSVLLNIAPDHLDHHGSFQDYRGAKAAIFSAQGDGDVHIGNGDDPAAAAVSSTAPCERRWFHRGEPDATTVGYRGPTLTAILDGAAIPLGAIDAGRAGYREDAAAAAAAALAFGVSASAVVTGLAAYEPQRHRGEEVARVDGVRFLDNSKATNVHAAAAAIAGVEDAVLIAGGRSKGQPLGQLADTADRLRAVVAIGEAASEIDAVFAGVVPVVRAGSIEEATARAFELAARPGLVLLAPACASWDQFTSYVERGARSAGAPRSLAKEVAAGG